MPEPVRPDKSDRKEVENIKYWERECGLKRPNIMPG
jgi:hypothetical protein